MNHTYKLNDLVSLKRENGEYHLEPNYNLLGELEKRGTDYYHSDNKLEFGVLDGFAGLYVTLVNRRDDVVIIEYHDEYVSMYKLARWGDVKDMVAVVCDETCSVRTPNKDEFDIVSE